MKIRNRLLIICTYIGIVAIASAQGGLTLEQCRKRALDGNKNIRQANEKQAEMQAMQKVALWQMLPKVSANGIFSYTDRDIRLLNDEQADELSSLGDKVHDNLVQRITNRFSNSGLIGSAIEQGLIDALNESDLTNTLNTNGQEIVDGFNPNIHSVTLGAVTLNQPLFVGGKLLAAYRTARLMNHLSGIEYDKKEEEVLIAVDEAYWQVVSVKHKQQLAEKYANLLRTLNSNVEQMVEAEVATKGDLAKVRVKLNEAEMSLTKANTGLVLAKMLLAQRCGMPLDTVFDVASIDLSTVASSSQDNTDSINMAEVLSHRHEMQMLAISDSIAQQAVTIARSTLLPNVALTGGYLFSNPNLFNGVEKEWGGSAMVGVVVNIPLVHVGGFYALRAAKHRRNQIAYQRQDAEEMIELQVHKLNYELQVAQKKLMQAQADMDNAEENLLLAEESFKAGMIGSSDLMAAQTAWVSAQGEVLDAEIEIAMDKVYLRQAMGIRE